jgi:serine/threonine-protein kinase
MCAFHEENRMNPERWQRVAQIFEAVMEQPPADRSVMLERLCEGDSALRKDVESMLWQDQKQSPLDHPVWDAERALLRATERLGPGTRVGPYVIDGILGTGGMGEVYRASDSNLGRSVALKVLPSAFATNAEWLARFQREARLLASLNHPNIAAIYGLEQGSAQTDPDVRALVLEFVEGPTLADRLTAGPVALDEVLSIARQVAEALEAANDQGIIHRDLKPANIKLRSDGTVKVLDFRARKAI